MLSYIVKNMKKNENNFEILNKFICTQNIDRIKYYNDISFPEINTLAVGYHLDKKTNTKSGGIFPFTIEEDTGVLTPIKEKTFLLDYGILDIKCISKSGKQLLYTANSDYSFSIFDFSSQTSIKHSLNESMKEITCNTLEIFPQNDSDNKLILVTNDGYHHIYDINTFKKISSIKSHEYGIWSLYILDNNTFITGSEDNSIKQWDIREPLNNKPTAMNNKSHQSSINSITKLNINNNILMTGSYDEKVTFFDIRNLFTEVNQVKTEHSTWDIKQTKSHSGKNLILMASIYEGFNIWEIDLSLNMNHLLRLPVKKDQDLYHKSIVYGIDIRDKKDCVDILSCSFYDNLIMHWKYFG